VLCARLAVSSPEAPVPAPHHPQQILDKDEFTLEELLEEDDIVQECKSLNGRLVAL
jgi:hypothetical protein